MINNWAAEKSQKWAEHNRMFSVELIEWMKAARVR